MFDFQNIEVYKKAKAFHADALQLLQTTNLHRTVNDQLYRSSLSVVLNIAEGSGRFSNADRRHFFVIARSSIFECVAILDVLKDGCIIDDQHYSSFARNAEELSRILYAMVKNLSK